MQVKTAIYDAAIELGLDLERVSSSVSRDVLSTLIELQAQLKMLVLSGVETNKDLMQALKQAQEYIEQAYATAAAVSSGSLVAVATVTASSYAAAISVSIGGEGLTGKPTQNQLEALAKNIIVDGLPHGKWWSKQQESIRTAFERVIRQGFVNQQSSRDVAANVADMMQVSMRNADALVRTSINAVSTEAQLQTIEKNDDLVKAFEWNATLDARTCVRCGVMDGKRWDSKTKEPIGHSVKFIKPPLHFNDRCRLIPITKTFKELGVDLPEFEGVGRSSDTGYTQDQTFKQFLERKGSDYQDKVLGKGRAKLWRDGKITFNQLIDGRGNPLTLKELTEKYID